MALEISQLPVELLTAVRQKRLVLFVGAGLSKQATPAVPNWRELLSRMSDIAEQRRDIDSSARAALEQLLRDRKFLMAAQELRERLPTDHYNKVLDEQFRLEGVEPAPIHRRIFELKPKMVITTNYDRLLEDGYSREYGKTANVATSEHPEIAQRHLQNPTPDRPLIFKIHGSITDPNTIVLTESDYRRVSSSDGYRRFLSAVFMTHVVLLLGFSLEDPELSLHFAELRHSLKYNNYPDYALMPGEALNAVERRRWRQDFGVEVLTYNSSIGHSPVIEFVETLIADLQSHEQQEAQRQLAQRRRSKKKKLRVKAAKSSAKKKTTRARKTKRRR